MTEEEEKRYLRIEESQRTADKKISHIEATVDSMASTVSLLSSDQREFMRVVSNRLNEVNKTNWAPIGIGLTILGGILITYVTLSNAPIMQQTQKNYEMMTDFIDKRYSINIDNAYELGAISKSLEFLIKDYDRRSDNKLSINNRLNESKDNLFDSKIDDLLNRLENIETSRFSVKDGDDIKERLNILETKD